MYESGELAPALGLEPIEAEAVEAPAVQAAEPPPLSIENRL
jgi:hypothetical protein